MIRSVVSRLHVGMRGGFALGIMLGVLSLLSSISGRAGSRNCVSMNLPELQDCCRLRSPLDSGEVCPLIVQTLRESYENGDTVHVELRNQSAASMIVSVQLYILRGNAWRLNDLDLFANYRMRVSTIRLDSAETTVVPVVLRFGPGTWQNHNQVSLKLRATYRYSTTKGSRKLVYSHPFMMHLQSEDHR